MCGVSNVGGYWGNVYFFLVRARSEGNSLNGDTDKNLISGFVAIQFLKNSKKKVK